MTNFAKLVPIPDLDTVNIGLSPCHQATMLKIFGRPGALSKDCSDVTNSKLDALIETRNIGPFKATGIGRLLDDLQAIFTEVKEKLPELFSQGKDRWNAVLPCGSWKHGEFLESLVGNRD